MRPQSAPTTNGYDVIMTERMGVAEVKQQFADVLGRVHHRGERFIIERRGTPLAALVPISDLDDDAGGEGGLLNLVGAFADAPELGSLLDDAVEERGDQPTRAVADLT